MATSGHEPPPPLLSARSLLAPALAGVFFERDRAKLATAENGQARFNAVYRARKKEPIAYPLSYAASTVPLTPSKAHEATIARRVTPAIILVRELVDICLLRYV